MLRFAYLQRTLEVLDFPVDGFLHWLKIGGDRRFDAVLWEAWPEAWPHAGQWEGSDFSRTHGVVMSFA